MLRHTLRAALLAGLAFATLPAAATPFRYATANDILGLDPHTNNHGVTNTMKMNIYEPLVRRLPDGGLAPALAERWELVNPTTWRFELARNVRFHGGEPFSAEDVVFSFDRVRQPNSDMAYTVAAVERMTVIDPHTIEVVTRGPNPVLLQDLTLFFIVSRAWVEANGAATVQRAASAAGATGFMGLNANGTGPFRVVERAPDERTVLEPNPNFRERLEHGITRATFRPVSNAATRMAAVISGELDLMYHVPLQNVQQLQGQQGIRIIQGPTARTIYLGLDTARPELSDLPGRPNPLRDVRVRRAIYQAIDIQGIQRAIMRNSTTIADQLVAPAVQGHVALPRLPFDQNAARNLLREAGYPEGFPLTLTCPNNRYINDEAICTAIIPMLTRVGIQARLQGVPFAQFISRGNNREFQFWLLGWTPGNMDLSNPLSELLGSGPNRGSYNWGGYNNPAVEALRERIQIETDIQQRQRLANEVWTLVNQDVPVIPLHQEPQIFAVRDSVADFTMRVTEDVELRAVRMRAR
jgi:peptide/nickel transport system substrate-binding protein